MPPNNVRQSAGKVVEDGHGSELPIEEDGTRSQQEIFAQDASSHESTERLQCSVAISDRTQTAKNFTKRQSPVCGHLTEVPVIESKSAEKELGVNDPLGENAEGALSHSNLIPFGEESSSKASTSCQSSACSPRELKRSLSVPLSAAPHHSCKLETEPNLINPTAPMFTSTIVSVLAPNWNGRLRRHKRGVGEVEQDIQESGHNSNLSAPSQNARRQSFLFSQMKPGGEMLDEFNSKLREPAGTRRNSVEWERDTRSSHLTATYQTNRPLLKPIHPNHETADHNNEFRTTVLMPLDTNRVPGSPLSPQPGGCRKRFQSGDQGKSFSPPTSRPTTSSLLLSWRRLNSRKANAEATEMEKQLAETIDSLPLLRKSRLRVSQPHSPLVTPDNPTQERFMPYAFPAPPDRLQSPVKSPGGRVIVTSKKSMFLNKGEFDISSRSASETSKEGLYLSSPTGPGQSETLNAHQQCSKKAVERKCSHIVNNVSVEPSNTDYTNLYNTNVNNLHRTANFPNTCISPRDNANNNIGNLISHHYHIKKDTIHPTEISPNISACMQSDSIYDVINSNKVNTANTSSTSKSTMAFSSHTSPKTIHTHADSPSAVLTSMPLSQSTQNSILNACHLNPENLSPSPTNTMSRTFTDSLAFSPRKTVDGTSPSHVWLNYLNSKQSQSNQSPSDSTSPLSQSRPLRRVCAPSVYSYLREVSPPFATIASSEHTSRSPQTPFLKTDGDQIQEENKNPGTLRFTFDLSPVESQDSALIQNSCTPNAPQSLPPDFGRRSGSHISKSPYSTLISARPALNSALQNSSPPVSYQHTKFASYDSSTMSANPLKTEKDSYLSMPNDRLIQPSGSSEKQLKSETAQTSFASLETSIMSQNSQDDCPTTNLIPNTTQLKQSDMIIKNKSHEGPDSMFSLHSDKVNTYQGSNYKKHSSPLSTLAVSETVPGIVHEGVTALQIHDTIGTQRTNSKMNLFSRTKKDNNLTSAGSASKESLTHQDFRKEVLMGLNKMDQVLNRLKLKFGIKSLDEDFTTRRKTKNFSRQSLDLKDSESIRKEDESQSLKLPISSNSQRESHNFPGLSLGFKFKDKTNKDSPKVDEQRGLADENGNQFLGGPQSHNRPKPHYINRYATMPQTRKNTLGPSPIHHPEFALKDVYNDDVFYSPTRRKNIFIYMTEDVSPTVTTMNSQKQHLMGAHLSASCADLKYGLERGRSVSVNSIVSGRPSGPGRISTGSTRGSVSDLTSSEEFGTRSRHSSMSSPGESPGYDAKGPSSLPVHSTYNYCVGRMAPNELLRSPVHPSSPYQWDTEPDPTPPPSPPFSPPSRRISPRPSSSSAGSRTSQDSLSPCGFLPSRNYKSTLSVFEESCSDTTTDDEYYLNSDDEKETEL